VEEWKSSEQIRIIEGCDAVDIHIIMRERAGRTSELVTIESDDSVSQKTKSPQTH
jgi:hypothetical protein